MVSNLLLSRIMKALKSTTWKSYITPIKDIFVKTAGATVTHKRLGRDCSYPCHEISNEMVTFDIILPLEQECPETLDPEMIASEYNQDHPCNPNVS